MKIRKTVIIVGAGISGLSAGIYAEQHGLHAIIIEKNPVVGGFCVGWTRKDRYLDGCIHWLTGTKEGTELNGMWKNVRAFSDQDDLLYLDSFGTFEYQGKTVTFWTDIKKAEKEFIEIAPEDKKEIRRFFKMVKDFTTIEEPLETPVGLLSFKKLLRYGVDVLSVWPSYLATMKISCDDYAKRFKSPILRWALMHLQPGDGNLFSMLFSYATIVNGNGGIPKGGSKVIVERMKNYFYELGGTLRLNTPVKRIIVEKKMATAVELENGEIIKADYFITALDANYAITHLLDNKYYLPYVAKGVKNYKKNPCPTCCLLNLVVEGVPTWPTPLSFETEPFVVGDSTISHITVRNYAYDKETFVKNNETIVSALIDQYGEDYEVWKKLRGDMPHYQQEKIRITNEVIRRIEQKFPEYAGKIKCLDIATPWTMHRYTNATRGAYMSFLFTKHSRMVFCNGHIKGINNLYMAGQWMQTPGGLPLALVCGKFAVQRICKNENMSYVFKPLLTLSPKFKNK